MHICVKGIYSQCKKKITNRSMPNEERKFPPITILLASRELLLKAWLYVKLLLLMEVSWDSLVLVKMGKDIENHIPKAKVRCQAWKELHGEMCGLITGRVSAYW